MVRRLLVVLLVALLGPSGAAEAAGLQATRESLSRAMGSAGAASGAHVVDLDTGETLYSLRADVARVPASVEKLYTTAAALLRYGTAGRLQTRLLAEVAPDEAGVVAGDVYLVGGGDPYLGRAQLRELIEEAGIEEIEGRVIGDESFFDERRGPPSSAFKTSIYVGPLSALTYNRGKTGVSRPFWQATPPLFAAQALHAELKRARITVGKRPRRGVAPETAVALAAVESAPMATLARLTNVPSDNFNAEQLIKALGAHFGTGGTTAAGAAVVRAAVEPFGAEPQVADGSGLSRSNRTTPRDVVELLEGMQGEATFEGSLAVAGRSGTLHRRMRGSPAAGRCHAKTGTLRSVSSLAGYCRTASGRRVAFAILMNRVSPTGARWLQDRMATALAGYSPSSS